jgi:predicted small integral membrane protein
VTVNQTKTTTAAKNVNFLGAFTFLAFTLRVAVFFLTAFLLCLGLAAGLTYFTPSCI